MQEQNKATYKELKKAERDILEYIDLVHQFSSLRWDDEDGRARLRPEIGRMRKRLSMEPLPGFPCES